MNKTAKSWIEARTTARSFGGQVLGEPMEGKKKGLVILVNFSDVQMTIPNPNETFFRYMNEEGYKENGQYGSVRDYFLSQSYGRFDFSFDVVGPVTLSKSMDSTSLVPMFVAKQEPISSSRSRPENRGSPSGISTEV